MYVATTEEKKEDWSNQSIEHALRNDKLSSLTTIWISIVFDGWRREEKTRVTMWNNGEEEKRFDCLA